jgi:hypothetical protein
MNKNVDGQRKRKPEKKHKGEKTLPKQIGWSRGKKRKEKGKSYRRNNNRGEIGKAKRKWRKRMMHGNKSLYSGK